MLGHGHCKESDGCFRGISSLTGNRCLWCSWGEGSSGLQLTTPPGKPYVWLLSLRSIILFPDTSSHVSLFKKFHDAWHQNCLGHSELSSGTFSSRLVYPVTRGVLSCWRGRPCTWLLSIACPLEGSFLLMCVLCETETQHTVLSLQIHDSNQGIIRHTFLSEDTHLLV